MVYLALPPDQRERLWREPGDDPAAIEEVLRHDAPSQLQERVALADATWHGVAIPAGARVALVTGAACRDEREFPVPDRFDTSRRPARRLDSGHGRRVCIGKAHVRGLAALPVRPSP